MSRPAKDNFLITIDTRIDYGRQKDDMSLTTTGSFYKKGDKFYIRYRESEATGLDGFVTVIKLVPGGARITRYKNGYSFSVEIEEGAVNMCLYPTPAGMLQIETANGRIDCRLRENGGRADISYSVSSFGSLISENKVTIKVKEIN